MNPDDLENRLRAVRPPEPPWELVMRLRAAEPPTPVLRQGWRHRLKSLFGTPWSPWRAAYAGVLAVWVAILVLRLLTLPLLPASIDRASFAQASGTPAPADAPPSERTFLLTRNASLDPSWP